jgi:PST family polysaccharide transporter
MDLKTKTVKGVGWVGLSQVIQLVVGIVIFIILTRLLTPSDFGLIAEIVVFTNFAALFSNLGLTYAIIQRKEVSKKILSSTFWVNLGLGVVLTVGLIILSPLIAAFYGQPMLVPLITVLSFSFVISSLSSIQSTLFAKELRFKILALVSIVSLVCSGVIAIVLALRGYGVWALVWYSLGTSLITTALLCVFSEWRPSFAFSWSEERAIMKYGLNLTGFNFVNYFSRNLDNLLIGRFLGPPALGFYDRAYQLMLFPLSNVSAVVGQVAFPALSIMQDDKKQVREAYIQATRLIAAITFPLASGMLILAPQFVTTFFGGQWTTSILLIQLLSLAAIIQSVVTTVGWVFMSQGRTDIMFRLGILGAVAAVIAFVVGIELGGLIGLTSLYVVASYLIGYINLLFAFKLIDLSVPYFIRRLRSVIITTFLAGAITLVTRFSLEKLTVTNDLVVLISASLIGLVAYLTILRTLDKPLIIEIEELTRTMLSTEKKSLNDI